MNILLLSAGRRTSLANLLADAAARRGGQLHIADCNGLAATAAGSYPGHPLPLVTCDEYPEALLRLVAENEIGAILPSIDADLLPLAGLRPQLAALQCEAIVSAVELLDATSDKACMAKVFSAAAIEVAPCWVPLAGQEVPASFCPAADEFVVKPRFGAGSADVLFVDRARLTAAIALVESPLVQARLDGPELSVDSFFDLAGQIRHYVPRERLKTMGGESIQGRTIDDADFGGWLGDLFAVMADLGARGPQTVQLFLTDTGPVLSEINPRFGGGVPLAHRAGGHYCEWLLDLLDGGDPMIELGAYTRDLYMTRAFVESYVERPRW